MPKKGKKLDEKQIAQHMETYSEETTGALLDEAFGRWDLSYDSNTVPYLDRADHTIINGRTATDLLMERFNEAFPTMKRDGERPWSEFQRHAAYGQFYREKGKKLINQMAANALANGGKVEVFVPDKATGRIKDTPMTLTATGYELAGPLVKPAQLTRWQKFWNKLGFYKKEKAAVVNYEKETAARQKVQFCNKAARANLAGNLAMGPAYREEMDKYHPEIREDIQKNFPNAKGNPAMLGETNGFKTLRSSFHAIVVGILATKRDENGKLMYTNEQIFDMEDPKMQKARADAAKEVYEHYKPGAALEKEKQKQKEMEQRGEKYEIPKEIVDKAQEAQDWLVDMQHDAADVLRDRISEQAGKLDFSKPDLTEQEGYREFSLLSDTAFDQSQDMNSTSKRMDEKYGKNAYWDAASKVGDWSQTYRVFAQSMLEQKNLVNGIPGKDDSTICKEVSTVFQAQTLQQQIAKTMKENPKEQFADVANIELIDNAREVQTQADFDDDRMLLHNERGEDLSPLMEQSMGLVQEYKANPGKFSRQIESGVFENRFELQELGEPGADEAAKFEIRDAAAAEREMKQREQQKAGGGPEL